MERLTPNQLSEMVSAYVDGELDARETQLVDRAAEKDASVRRLLEEFRRNRELVGSLPRHDAPPSVFMDVQGQIERTALLDDLHSTSDAGVLRVFRRLIPYAVAASLAFAGVGGWWYMQQLTPAPVAERSFGGSMEPGTVEETAVASRDAAPDTADRRSLEEKLAAEAPLSALQSHRFDVEPVRVAVAVDDGVSRAGLVAELTGQLAAADLVDLSPAADADANKRPQEPQATDRAFFIRGRRSTNFEGADVEQILVRAPARQVAELIGQLPETPDDPATSASTKQGSASRVTLQAGTFKVEGRARSQQMFQVLAEDSAASAPAARRATGAYERGESARPPLAVADARRRPAPADTTAGAPEKRGRTPDEQFLAELLKNVGVDPELLAGGEATKPPPSDADGVREPGTLVASRRASLKDRAADEAEGGRAARLEQPAPAATASPDPGEIAAGPAEAWVTVVLEITSSAGATPGDPTSGAVSTPPASTGRPADKPGSRPR